MTELEQFHELSYYTSAHQDPAFIHQLAVDAFATQNATGETKLVAVVMPLAGLYLHNEHGYTGRLVQDTHVEIGRSGTPWPEFILPRVRGDIRVVDVLGTQEGDQRDAKIEQWNRVVWEAYRPENIERISAYLRRIGLLEYIQ